MRIKTKLGITTFALLPFLMVGCDSNDESTPARGSFTINASGGTGGANGGSGGDGDYVEIYKENGMGDAGFMATGSVNAGFTALTPAGYTGTNPLAITTDTTIAVETTEPAAGVAYFVANDPNVYISDGNGTLESAEAAAARNIATGISVASGATLTLEQNYTTYAQVNTDADIVNNGTITTDDISATQRGVLYIYADSYIGSSTSSITTAGTLDSQSGGDIYISADGSIFNHGAMDSSGSDSAAADAGDGGYVYFDASYNVQNTANINSSGGNAAAGIAGSGDYVYMYGGYGFMHNSGDINSSGGNGETGGSGGYVYFYAWGNDMLNSGDIDSSGGDATAGAGGSGNYIDMYAYGGHLKSSGSLDTHGGSTTDTTASAGDGDSVYMYNYYADITDGYTQPGEVLVSGNINTSGGDAAATGTGSGGSGGYVYAESDSSSYPDMANNPRVAFLGYDSINTSGGDGNYGGDAGYVQVYNDYAWDDATYSYIPSGDAINQAHVTATGGNVVATASTLPASGGDGGNFDMETDYYYSYNTPEAAHTINTGNVDISGGDNNRASSNSSGNSGYVWMWGYNGVTNSGTLTANGGDDADTDGGTTGYGGYANDIQLWAETGAVVNTAALTNNGGYGEYRGGYSDGIELFGARVSNAANLSSTGGDADTALTGSVGGNAGWVEMFSPDGPAGVTHSGTVTLTGGAGESTTTVASDGSFIKGGLCVSGPCD